MAEDQSDQRLQPSDVDSDTGQTQQAADPLRRAAEQRETARKRAVEQLPEVEDPSNVPLEQSSEGFRIEKNFLNEIEQEREQEAKQKVRQSVAESLPEVDDPSSVPTVVQDGRVTVKPSFLESVEQQRRAEAKEDIKTDVAKSIPGADPSDVPVKEIKGGGLTVSESWIKEQQRKVAAEELSEQLGVEVSTDELTTGDDGFKPTPDVIREARAKRITDQTGVDVSPDDLTRTDDGQLTVAEDKRDEIKETQIEQQIEEEFNIDPESEGLPPAYGYPNRQWMYDDMEGVEVDEGEVEFRPGVKQYIAAEQTQQRLEEQGVSTTVWPSDIALGGSGEVIGLTEEAEDRVQAAKIRDKTQEPVFPKDVAAQDLINEDMPLPADFDPNEDVTYEDGQARLTEDIQNEIEQREQALEQREQQIESFADRVGVETDEIVVGDEGKLGVDPEAREEAVEARLEQREDVAEVQSVDVADPFATQVEAEVLRAGEQDASQPIDEQAANSARSPADARRAFRLADAGGEVELPDDASGGGDSPVQEVREADTVTGGVRTTLNRQADRLSDAVLDPVGSALAAPFEGRADIPGVDLPEVPDAFGVTATTSAGPSKETTAAVAREAPEIANVPQIGSDLLAPVEASEFIARADSRSEELAREQTVGEAAVDVAQDQARAAADRPAVTAGLALTGFAAGAGAGAAVRGATRGADSDVDVDVDDTPGERANPFADIDYSQPLDEQTTQLFDRPSEGTETDTASRIDAFRAQLREFASDERGQVQIGRQRQRDPDTGEQPYEPLDGRVIEDDLGTPDPVGEEIGRRRIAERQQLRDEGQDIGQPVFRQDRRDTPQGRRRAAQQRRVDDSDGRPVPDALDAELGLGLASLTGTTVESPIDSAPRQPIDDQTRTDTAADTTTRQQTTVDTATATIPDLSSPLSTNTPTKSPDRDPTSRPVSDPDITPTATPDTPIRPPRTPDLLDLETPDRDLDREFAFDARVEEEISAFINPLTGERDQ